MVTHKISPGLIFSLNIKLSYPGGKYVQIISLIHYLAHLGKKKITKIAFSSETIIYLKMYIFFFIFIF